MSQPDHRIIMQEGTIESGMAGPITIQVLQGLLTCTLDAPANPPPEYQTKRRQPEFTDSSGPLFLVYREMVEEEDAEMVKRCEKHTEGILVFVSLYLFLSALLQLR
jgi:hypothetical protein